MTSTETKPDVRKIEKLNLRRIAVINQILADAGNQSVEYIKRFKTGRGGE
jgi:hypothetical protein